jgi:hypothetical protein
LGIKTAGNVAGTGIDASALRMWTFVKDGVAGGGSANQKMNVHACCDVGIKR